VGLVALAGLVRAEVYNAPLKSLGPGTIPHLFVTGPESGTCWTEQDAAIDVAELVLRQAFNVVVVSDQPSGSFEVAIHVKAQRLFRDRPGCVGTLLVTLRRLVGEEGDQVAIELAPPKVELMVDRGTLNTQIRNRLRRILGNFVDRVLEVR